MYALTKMILCGFFNTKWKLITSIKFLYNAGPLIMKYREHNGGTNKLMFNPCGYLYHILSSAHPDQLCHSIILRCTTKTLKPAKYSSNFQMNEQQNTFNSINTFIITNYFQLDFCYKLSHGTRVDQ